MGIEDAILTKDLAQGPYTVSDSREEARSHDFCHPRLALPNYNWPSIVSV